MDIMENQDSSNLKAKQDRKQDLREMVNQLLPEGLMIALAVIMIPVVLLPIFIDLPAAWITVFNFLDYAILAIFVIEYVAKTSLAPNVLKHVLNPWHLLDLFVILVAVANFLPFFSNKIGRSSLLLRLLRIIRVVAVGGRTLDRKKQLSNTAEIVVEKHGPMQIQVMNEKIGSVCQSISFKDLSNYLTNSSQTWINISSVSESDFDLLSNALNIPRIVLESELNDESYPRIDNFEHYSLIFARIADVQTNNEGTTRVYIERRGLLVVCQGRNIITISRMKSDLFSQIIEKAGKTTDPNEPLVVTILYTILKYILEKDKQIIAALEQQLITLESIPMKKRPRNFLEITFHLRKEVNQLVPSLLHLKEIIAVITSQRMPLEGFEEKHEKIFDILMDEATYLHETATNARDNLESLVDLYINTTSYETNNVMRIIAVITSMSIIPAVMGLLGSNISGNPWDIQLWQVFGLLGMIILIMFWIFRRLGWLK